MAIKKGKAQMLALMLMFMECANEFTQETVCLIFVTGKADKPTKECCSTLIDIRDKDPVCLCYIMQQILNGTNPQLKSMGIQEPRLYQLPSACKSSDASITDCPSVGDDHRLFTDIDGLIKSVQVTLVEVADELLRSEDPDIDLNGVVNLLKRNKGEVEDENDGQQRSMLQENAMEDGQMNEPSGTRIVYEQENLHGAKRLKSSPSVF